MPESSNSGAESQSLANWLEATRHEIVSEWMQVIRDDPGIPDADHLTLAALQDHFPDMLGELVASLRDSRPQSSADIHDVANTHGRVRFRQSYRLDEVLRELARIREVLLARVRKYCEERRLADFRNDVDGQIRVFFDKVVASSARQFMKEQEAEVLLRTRQLQSAYEQVQAATDQLRATAQSRLRLLRGVSHELRNALQAIGMSSTALLEEADAQRRNDLNSHLSRDAVHLQRVLGRLQEFSNILSGEERLRQETMESRKFIEALEKTHRKAAEAKGLEFVVGAVEVESVQADPDKLRHVADILLSNAIEHTTQGSVEISALRDENDRWILRVTDTGSGMDENTARHVFHEFHRCRDATHRGVGLGLVVARHLAHIMDGEITFQTTPGTGTRFEVNLPVEARPETQ